MDPLRLTGPISPAVRSHLKLVYGTLACALAACTAGAYLDLLKNVGGWMTFIVLLCSLVWLKTIPPSYRLVVRGTPYCYYGQKKRFVILLLISCLEGACVGPVVKMMIKVDSSATLNIFVGTALTLVCFWVAAVLALRREVLYIGGLLSSCFSCLLWFQFGPSVDVFKEERYIGLIIFMGLFFLDTYRIVGKAEVGDTDHVAHALVLGSDFLAVTVTLIIVWVKVSQHVEERRRGIRRIRVHVIRVHVIRVHVHNDQVVMLEA